MLTDPFLVAAALEKSAEVEKNSKAVYSKFNVVKISFLMSNCCSSLLRECHSHSTAVQLNHAEGKGNIFTSPSDDYWRLIRKGIMPAFSSNNIRYDSINSFLTC